MDLDTAPITADEIALWQESTPGDYNDWDLETISDCDAFLSSTAERIQAVSTIRENYAVLISRAPGLIGANTVLDMIDAALAYKEPAPDRSEPVLMTAFDLAEGAC